MPSLGRIQTTGRPASIRSWPQRSTCGAVVASWPDPRQRCEVNGWVQVDTRRYYATAAPRGAGRIHAQGRGRWRRAGCRLRRRQRLPRPPRRHDRVVLDPRGRDDRGALQHVATTVTTVFRLEVALCLVSRRQWIRRDWVWTALPGPKT